ncbi:MAG: glycogen-binding domain-containing protein [Alkalispirochaetaceae bacterium]
MVKAPTSIVDNCNRKMVWRILILTALSLSLLAAAAGAQEPEEPELQNIQLYREIRGLTEAEAPQIIQGHLVFTYRPSERERRSRFTRLVGIAFAHEQFSRVYPFRRLRLTEFASEDLFYYVLPIEPNRRELVYRLVVDGLWGPDPENDATRRLSGGMRASTVTIPSDFQREEEFPVVEENRVRFALELNEVETPFLRTLRDERLPTDSLEANAVYIAGSFNNWDPFMHRLRQDPNNPDRFTTSLRVPPGVHYYYFVVDGVRILDPENLERGFDPVTNSRASRLFVER